MELGWGEMMGCHKQLQRKLILAAYLEGYLGLLGFICGALAWWQAGAASVLRTPVAHGKARGVPRGLSTACEAPRDTKLQLCKSKRGSWAMTINLCWP